MRNLPSQITDNALKLAPSGAFLFFLEFSINQAALVRVTTALSDTTFAGVSWRAFPFAFNGDTEDDTGELAGASVVLSNVQGEWTALLEGAGGLEGKTVVVWRAHTGNLTASAAVRQTFEITGARRVDTDVILNLGRQNFFNLSTPRDYYRRDTCGVVAYKNQQCLYAGQTRAIVDITNSGGTALVETDTPHGLNDSLVVAISGNSVGGYNVTASVEVVTGTTFRLVGVVYTADGTGGTVNIDRPTCDRTLYGGNGCIAHDNVLQFRGFPCLPRAL